MNTVAVLVGSLRRESINRKFAESVGRLAAGRLDFRFVEIGDLPLYNDDLWQDPPSAVLRMKREVEAADGVLFVTPEYNRYFSPAIKNAVDWGTRPWGKNSWATKPAAIIGASPGAIGAAAGQNTLKGLLTVCDMVLMGQPEVYFSYKPELFDAGNNVADEATKKFLNGWIDRFAAWIERTSEPRTAPRRTPSRPPWRPSRRNPASVQAPEAARYKLRAAERTGRPLGAAAWIEQLEAGLIGRLQPCRRGPKPRGSGEG